MKALLSKKKLSAADFDKSSKFIVFLCFCQKTLNSDGKISYLWNIIFLYAFYKKSTTFADSEKLLTFCKKLIVFFQKKHEFRTFWDISLL